MKKLKSISLIFIVIILILSILSSYNYAQASKEKISVNGFKVVGYMKAMF